MELVEDLTQEEAHQAVELDKLLEAELLKAIGAPDLSVHFLTDDETYEVIERSKGYDEESAHINADRAIYEFLLNVLHLRNSARIFHSMPKWFS